jgi:hypothetical protein
MKIFFLLLLLAAFTTNAFCIDAVATDGKKVILNENGTWKYKKGEPNMLYAISACYDNDYIIAKDGYDNDVKVSCIATEEFKDKFSVASIKNAAVSILLGCQNTLKSRLSFVPVSLFLSLSDDGEGGGLLKMRGKNAYGAEQETNCVFQIDSNGKVVAF